jgi:hypothetical protein
MTISRAAGCASWQLPIHFYFEISLRYEKSSAALHISGICALLHGPQLQKIQKCILLQFIDDLRLNLTEKL